MSQHAAACNFLDLFYANNDVRISSGPTGVYWVVLI